VIALGVNIDHVATLRQARRAAIPTPLHAALIAEEAGADSITLHLARRPQTHPGAGRHVVARGAADAT